MWRSERGWALASSVGVLVWAVVLGDVPAAAAGIDWQKPGAFQACLDAKAKAWIDAKVELVVNDDPNMGAIDDAAVAEWATRALRECGAKASGGDPASEQQFMKYMAHWRDHIYKAADEIRRRGRPD
ncbi:MAG: hypothetical protein J2P50_15960 [Hyphomicrobiaceae bacterium]|nr:hypothetical protein [Hyphomicrobiaceae bacterium]